MRASLASRGTAVAVIVLASWPSVGHVKSAQKQGAGVRPSAPARKLIEFGWDEPDTAFLRSHQREIEQTPFDGCVFHVIATPPGKPAENFTWLCWGRRAFSEHDLAAAFADLRAITWSRFTHNFLRFNVTPGDLDWFDEHGAVLANARLVARLAREGHCRGVLLDTEQYEKGLFQYRKQRDAARKSWDEYAAQARRRGREFITALQGGYPDLTLMVTFGPSLVWTQGDGGRKPPSELDYGLLVPFFDGLIEGARGQTRIVDGYELSYGYRERSQFERGRDAMKEQAAGLMADPNAYRRVVSAGFGLWLDHDWRKRGWKTDDLEKNHFSPSRFEAALRSALDCSDEYVWIYSETPRWWGAEGKSVGLPEAYDRAVRAARGGRCRELGGPAYDR